MERTACALAFIILASSALAQTPGYIPPAGFVPNAETAISIARAVLIPIYGAKAIQAEEPLTAERHGDVWVVEGTLPCPKGGSCVGGTAELQLSAKDGRILHVIHYQ
jgi:hypothetical protein